MKQIFRLVPFVAIVVVAAIVGARAQQSPSVESPVSLIQVPTASVTVPPLVPITGVLLDSSGNPLTGSVNVVLAIYSAAEGGPPLWTETQTVQADQRGRYSVTLGATSPRGIPVGIFASAGFRWLGVSPLGQPELARTPILSVAYALKSADADTLGGKPASAFALAQPEGDSNLEASGAASNTDKTSSTVSTAAPTPGPTGGVTATQFTSTNSTGPSFISQATSGPPLQVSSVALNTNLNADLLDGFHAAAFPQLGTANVFSANQTFNATITAGEGSFSGNNGLRVLQVTQAGAGAAIQASANSATGGVGVQGNAQSPSGTGVLGMGSSTSGSAIGVRGDTFSPSGRGIYGLSASGISGIGVDGEANATSGSTVGVRGLVRSSGGVAGLFDNMAAGTLIRGTVQGVERFRVDGTGAIYANSYRDLAGNPIPTGTGDITGVAAGPGLTGGGASGDVNLALNTAFTDGRYAQLSANTFSGTQTAPAFVGDGAALSNVAKLGANTFSGNQIINGSMNVSGAYLGNDSGQTHGLRIEKSGAGAAGFFRNNDENNANPALFVITNGAGSGTPAAVFQSANQRGETVSVAATNLGLGGAGSFDIVNGSSPATALTATTNGGGIAAVFNANGGDILHGQSSGIQKFRVDGTGAVYANSYHDLAGNPIPTGTGDITAIAAGTGLTGGGQTGDVSVGLDTNFTDGRYSPLVHGHDVTQITNAARLNAGNTFNGNQSITGSVTVSGDASFDGGLAGFGGPTKVNAVGVRGETTSSTAEGVLGTSLSTSGRGVRGVTFGTNGVGIKGEATSTTGTTTGVLGTVASAGGVSGSFENAAGGDLLRGAVQGSQRFRVDGTGAVYANSYRDLAGNPIPTGTGDITAVAAGTGLTGGGQTGDVSVGLDTNFTDGRYSPLVHGHDVTQITNAARLSSNTFTSTQTIDTGNVDLDPSSATAGNITKNGTRFLHNFGSNNTFVGESAGNFSTTGLGGNAAIGSNALVNNASGFQNAAIGSNALRSNTGGNDNTAAGTAALFNNTTGVENAASGSAALFNNTTGNDNVALGKAAGFNASTGSNNIYIGSNVLGVGGESNAIYLGNQGTQTKTVIAGIRGTTVTGGEAVVIDANGRLGSAAVAPTANSVGSTEVIDESLTSADLAPNSVGTSELAPDSVTADKVAFNYAASIFEGGPASDLACVGCVSASEVSFTFASAGANTFTATQTIDTGNLDLDTSTGTAGNITKNGVPFLHNFGPATCVFPGCGNTFMGLNTGNFALTGDHDTGLGVNALQTVTSGRNNTAVGYSALYNATAGSENVAVGAGAGFALGAGNWNIYIGSQVGGASSDSNTIRIGIQGQQQRTYIAGIFGTTTLATAVPVMIDGNGNLGTISSSRRFKEDIHDMADASNRLFKLRPVTFRYKQAYADGSKPTQFGLIAEEVAKVFPELAVRNADGSVETVHYETLSVLLLNEMQSQERRLREQGEQLQRQQQRIEALEQQLSELAGSVPKRR